MKIKKTVETPCFSIVRGQEEHTLGFIIPAGPEEGSMPMTLTVSDTDMEEGMMYASGISRERRSGKMLRDLRKTEKKMDKKEKEKFDLGDEIV